MSNMKKMDGAKEIGRDRTMQTYVDFNMAIARDRIRARETEAAGERLAAAARDGRVLSISHRGGVRRQLGLLLISAGRRVAGEPASSGSSAARPASSMAA